MVKPLPEDFAIELQKTLLDNPFYRKNMVYDIMPIGIENSYLKQKTTVSYTLINLSEIEQKKEIKFPAPSGRYEINDISINGKSQNIFNQDIKTDIGLKKLIPVKPGEEILIKIITTELCELNGGDMFTTYDPCIGLKINIRYDEFDRVKYRILDRCPFEGKRIKYEKLEVWETESSLLSYQGIWLDWKANKSINS